MRFRAIALVLLFAAILGISVVSSRQALAAQKKVQLTHHTSTIREIQGFKHPKN